MSDLPTPREQVRLLFRMLRDAVFPRTLWLAIETLQSVAMPEVTPDSYRRAEAALHRVSNDRELRFWLEEQATLDEAAAVFVAAVYLDQTLATVEGEDLTKVSALVLGAPMLCAVLQPALRDFA